MYISVTNRVLALPIFCIFLMLSACYDGIKKYVMGNDVIYVNHFNTSAQLSPIDNFHCPEFGLKSVKVVDSLLILTHSNSWSLHSFDAQRYYGACLQSGEGPNELLSLPRCGSCAYAHERDSLIAYVCDKDRGKLFVLNITKFLESKDITLTLAMENPHVISNDSWEAIPLDSSTLAIAMPNTSFTGFNRLIVGTDTIYEPKSTKRLSQPTVKTDADINLLAKVTRAHPDGGKCVEAMLYLNQINVFATDGSWSRTLCVGHMLDDLSDIEAQFRFDRINTYITVSAMDFGFGAVFAGATEKELQMGETNVSEIHFFDWEGTPVFRALMPIAIKAFDIDTSTRILYVIDANEDTLGAYDATPILNSFNLTLGKQ